MTVTARFITASRDDLFAMTRALVGAIEDGMLQDPADPVIVAVTGTGNSGKKIVTDAAREFLLGTAAHMRGWDGMDEYWTGDHGGLPCEIHFIDTFYYDCYSNSRIHFHDYDRAINEFLSMRTQGGMTFMQNTQKAHEKTTLSVHIESPMESEIYLDFSVSTAPHWRKDTSLCRFFAERAARAPWLRYVEVTAHDPRLMTPGFLQKSFKAIKPESVGPTGGVMPASVYGQDCFVPGTAP